MFLGYLFKKITPFLFFYSFINPSSIVFSLFFRYLEILIFLRLILLSTEKVDDLSFYKCYNYYKL